MRVKGAVEDLMAPIRKSLELVSTLNKGGTPCHDGYVLAQENMLDSWEAEIDMAMTGCSLS